MSAKGFNGLGRLCRRSSPTVRSSTLPIRTLTTTSLQRSDVQPSSNPPSEAPPPPSNFPSEPLTPKQHALLTPADPNTAHDRRLERVLMRQGRPPIGSRRRRAALSSSDNIPFEQLPYQCFQEARQILQEDRAEKLADITKMRARIERVKLQEVGRSRNAILFKERRLLSMMQRLEKLKILADINDPLVKKQFEDGEGDMNKPIYRHLAFKKFKGRKYLILKQRLEQMHVYPDLLPPFDVTYDVALSFGRHDIAPGEFVHSALSERPPRLTVQPFDRGERYVTIAVVDPDVPDVEGDGFSKRCHFLAVNIPVGPTKTKVNVGEIMGSLEMKPRAEGEEGYESQDAATGVTQEKREVGDCLLPWLPPYAQKGSPYHRLSVIVLQQYRRLEPSVLKKEGKFGGKREDVNVVALMSRFHVRPVSGFLFRTQWDGGMDALMGRMGVEGVGEELKRKRVEPLPYKWKPSMSERYR
ncbi:MAG: hypothetical protein Q9162_006095 [Coniocarpon cinnabarinum]